MVGDVPGALEALRWALQVGVDPVPIADALADGVRTVARVAAAGRGSAYQLASSLGMPAWKIERAQRQARGWSAAGLAAAMQATAVCNAEVKGGSEDRGYALERAVFAMSAARIRAAMHGMPGPRGDPRSDSIPLLRARAASQPHPPGRAAVLPATSRASVALAVLLALAELVNWWAVLVLPVTVAGLVKINDIVAGAFARAGPLRRDPTTVQRPVTGPRHRVRAAAAGTGRRADGTPVAEPDPPAPPRVTAYRARSDDASAALPVIPRPRPAPATNQRRSSRRPRRHPARRHAPSRDSITLSRDGSAGRGTGLANGMTASALAARTPVTFDRLRVAQRAGRDQAAAGARADASRSPTCGWRPGWRG